VISAGGATYAWLDSNALVLAGAVGAASASILILAVNFSIWYLNKRGKGWRKKAKDRAVDHVERDLERKVSGRMALALKLCRDLSLHRLEISDPSRRLEETSAWLTARLWPAMKQLSPEIGIGVLQWHSGLYSLGYDAAVPEIIRKVLPKRTNREFSACLAELQLIHHHVPLGESMGRDEGAWLIAFPGEDFDLAIDTVFSVGAGIVADAWGQSDLGGPLVLA
jgi:hypothetical protein